MTKMDLIDEQYELDVEDEETLCEFRRCYCGDTNFLSTYGPINPLRPREGNVLLCSSSPNGTCAMMVCDCHDDEEDWYSGSCDFCGVRIEGRHEAVRIPMYHGGFKGCYCSKQCMHLVFADNTHSWEHVLIEIMYAFLDQYPVLPETSDDSTPEDPDVF